MKKLLLFLLSASVATAAGQLSSSFIANGAAGAGYVEVANQSAAPATPTAGGRLFFDSANRLSWRGTDGNTWRIFASPVSVAALKALSVTGLITGQPVNLEGYYLSGDGGGGVFVYNSTSSATDNGGTIIAPNAGAGRWLRSVEGNSVTVLQFGAKADAATDDTTAFNNAITYVSSLGGGIVQVPAKASAYLANGIVLKDYVTLQGESYKNQPGSHGSTLQKKSASGHLIKLAATYPDQTLSPGVRDLVLIGAGASYTGRAINFGPECSGGQISGVDVHNFASEGIYLGGGATIFKDSIVTLCVLNYGSLAAPMGAVFVAGTDHLISNVEVQTSFFQGRTASAPNNAPTSSSLYAVGWLVSSSSATFTNCIGELSDVGFLVRGITGIGTKGTDEAWPGTQQGTRFIGCRADRNAAQGWWIQNGVRQCLFDSCISLSNGSGGGADGVYDGWVEGVAGTGGDDWNSFVNCSQQCILDAFAPYKVRYGFFTTSTFGTGPTDIALKSAYIGIRSLNHTTAVFASSGTSLSGIGSIPWDVVPFVGGNWIEGDNSATPALTGATRLGMAHSGSTTITNFTGGINGQDLLVWARDANTILSNNSNIRLLSGRNESLATGEVRQFSYVGGQWIEIGPRSLSGSGTYDPASLNDGEGVTTTIAVTGALLGDFVSVSFSNDLQGVLLTGYVSAGDVASVRFQNETGGVVDLASGTLQIKTSRY